MIFEEPEALLESLGSQIDEREYLLERGIGCAMNWEDAVAPALA